MTLQRSDEWMKSWFYYYPRRWSDYFASFGAGLPLLRHFAIGHSEAWDSELGMPFTTNPDLIPALMRDRYMAFDGGIGPSQFLSPRLESERKDWPQCDDEDRTALKALYHKINQPVDCGEFTLGSYEVIDLVASR
ncbi:uncharacterized protein N7511_002435 [Penicillium nucicola]|uniref:uncharacterized protein n=1 Tax=Penicillium nucicola TaxID=1850975 RepID=UPI002544EDB0|nr:uncharacterized protein N7511_002435 [Penicillium nucicola]KAJ5770384.1 hypothetical protein N7511_002435 [Penicillium nucicola]